MEDYRIDLTLLTNFFKEKQKFFKEEFVNPENQDQTYKIYKHPCFPDNVYFREVYVDDSYNERTLDTYGFVILKEKQVTVYENI